jgi:hypothetical protein
VSARVEPESVGAPADTAPVLYGAAAPLALGLDPDERFGGHALPRDHPAWMRDTLSISQRTRALLGRLKPVALKVVAYWEHRVRSIAIGNARLSVDASGSYRLD